MTNPWQAGQLTGAPWTGAPWTGAPWTGAPWTGAPWTGAPWTGRRRPRVLFGQMYEDHAVELAVFPPSGRVLAIASAGDTAGALAAAGHRVTAVDLNPVQLAYARARMAGGPTVTGTAERLLAIGRAAAGTLMPAWRPASLTDFLRLTDPAEQADWWRYRLDRAPLRALLSGTVRPAGPLAAVLRRGLREVMPPRFDRILRERIAAGVARYPNATNPWAWRLLLGHPDPTTRDQDTRRPATQAHGTRAHGTTGIEWVHADVVEQLRRVPPGWYDAVTLSNILDGPPPAFARRLLDALRHAVRPGGPVVLRTFRDRTILAGRPLADRSLLWGAVTLIEVED